MSKRDDRVSVRQMLDHAREAVAMVRDRSRHDLGTDRLLNLSLTRLLEIIGEAASRVSEGFREAHAEVAWAEIIGLRNRLIHGYDVVDLDILWEIVQRDLPTLVLALETILKDE
jgi:uncharacterized protein with HEPN domain